MKALLFAGALAVCCYAITQDLPDGDVQSAPFNLIVLSQSSSLNGSFLGAYHEGAAEESLCISQATSQSEASQFQWNGTYWSCSDTTCHTNVTNVTIGIPGVLAYYFPVTINDTMYRVPQSMTLARQGVSSNLAFATIAWQKYGDNIVAFDEQGFMNLQDTLDPKDKGGDPHTRPKAYYHWYICNNYWGTYHFQHLMWRYGDGEQWDSTCESVRVKQIYVTL